MKIVHYMPRIDLNHGGPVRAVLDLCARFNARSHDVTLVTYCDDDLPNDWTNSEPGTPTACVIAPPTLPMSLFGAGARQEIAKILSGADIIHLHETWTPSNIQFGKIANRLGIPYVISPRGMLDDWCMAQKALKKRLFHTIAGRSLFENAAFVHCTAEAELAQSRKWFPRGQGRVIPNLLDLEPYKALPPKSLARERFPQLAQDIPSLLFLSRIHMKKGIEHLVRAAAQLDQDGTPCNILIAGSGDDTYVTSLKQAARDAKIDHRLSFLGLVTGDLKLSLYHAADVFVLPTSQENFGFVLIEALAAGTPVLTTKGVDIWPELEASGGARIIDDATGEHLVEAIRAMIAQRDQLDDMGQRGRAWVMQNLDSDQTAQKFEAMYTDAVKQSQGA
jgi:glycosyltransferase involved in cell wall biosynthesis